MYVPVYALTHGWGGTADADVPGSAFLFSCDRTG